MAQIAVNREFGAQDGGAQFGQLLRRTGLVAKALAQTATQPGFMPGPMPSSRDAPLMMFRQAAELGGTDAHLRIGERHENGKATKRDTAGAMVNYRTACCGW